jgi:RNA polymerase sigma factor (sigma-70 family)
VQYKGEYVYPPDGPEMTPLQATLHQLAADEPDRDLLRRYADGRDPAAFAAIVRRHGPMVLGVCRRTLGDAHLAEDAFQATFLVLARKATALRRPASLAGWLYGVAIRVARRARTRARRPEPSPRNQSPEWPDPLNQLTAREVVAVLEEELSALPDEFRLPVALCCLDGLSQEEAARRLGWTPGSVKGRLERGRARLRKRLERRGLAPAIAFAAAVAVGSSVRAVPAQLVHTILDSAVRTAAPGSVPAGRLAIAVLLVAGAVGLGAFLGPATPPPVPVTPPARASEPVADRLGDPLPAGAVARLGTVRFRHGGPVFAAAFRPDGSQLVSVGRDHVLRVWDVKTSAEVRHFAEPGPGWNSLDLAPDGKTVAASSETDWVGLWDASTGTELGRWKAGQGRTTRVAFAPNGKVVASAGTDGTVKLWAVPTGAPVKALGKHDGVIWALAFSPDGKTIASGGADASARLWDVTTGRQRHRLTAHTDWVESVAFSPDGRTLVTGGRDQSARFWDVETGRERGNLAFTERVFAVAFAPDGKTLATATWDKKDSVRLWDPGTGKELVRLNHPDRASCLAFTADGKALAVGGPDNTIRIWDTATGRERPDPGGHQGSVRGVAVTADGKTVATAGEDRTVRLWDAATGREQGRLPVHEGLVLGAAFSPDGRSVATVGEWLPVRLWDVATGKMTVEFRGHRRGAQCVGFMADGSRLVTASYDNTVRVWDVAGGREVASFSHPDWVSCVSASPDGRTVVSGCDDNNIRVWDVAAGRESRTLLFTGQPGNRRVLTLAFSPDGRLLAAAGYDRSIRVWDTATWQERVTLSGPPEGTLSVAFSPDSRCLFAGAGDRTVRVFDLSSGSEVGRLVGHRGGVNAVAVAPDGRAIITASEDTTALVWDGRAVRTGLPTPKGLSGRTAVEQAWTALAGTDAKEAHRALWALAATPDETLTLLRERLRPVTPVEKEILAKLIRNLDSDQFREREAAARQLTALGDAARPALERALANGPSAEAGERLRALIRDLDDRPLTPADLQALRGVEVLERIGDRRAWELLEGLAAGAGTRLPQAARQALGRLASK